MLSGTWVPRSRVPDCIAILFGTQWVPGTRSRVPDCWVPESIVVIWDRVSWVPDPGSLIVTTILSGTQTRTIKRGYVMLVLVPGPRSLIVLLVFGVLHGSHTIMVPQFIVAFCCNRSFFRVPERRVAPGGATILYGSLDCTAMFWIPSWVPDNYGPKKYSCIPRCNYTFWDPAKVFF